MSTHAQGEPSSATRRPRPTVLYVMGAGRSGSTILGVALGNCDGVFFAGELDKWFERAGIPRSEDPQLRRFWEGVRGQLGSASAMFSERTGWLVRSSALLDPRKWSTRRRLRCGYRRASLELYEELARATGAAAIVDSSHYPLRAREMQALSGIELHLLFLTREPHSVVASLGRRDVVERRFGALAGNGYLWLTNLLSLYVYLRQPAERRLFVRHEDFVAEPERVLAAILDGAGLTPPLSLGQLATGTPFHGNRLLQSPTVTLSAGAAAPAHRSRLTAVLQAPWRLVFARLGAGGDGRRNHGESPSR